MKLYPYRTEDRIISIEVFVASKMINSDDATNKNKKEHNSSWPYFQDHP